MQKQSDLIKQGVKKILDIACNDPDREVKATRIAEEMLFKTVAVRRETASGSTQPKSTLPKVAAYYNMPDREEWIAKMRERYSDQIQFAEAISVWYSFVMGGLSPLQAKILLSVLDHYYTGVSGREIARLCFEAPNTTTSILNRLVKAGLVQTKQDIKDKRRTSYYVLDTNWLRVHALHNGVFRKWLPGNTSPREDVIDRFITWFVRAKIEL